MVWRYGRDWCWSRDAKYQQLRAALDQSIIANEFDNVKDCSSEIMSQEQFQALHSLTLEMANNTELPFPTRLLKYTS